MKTLFAPGCALRTYKPHLIRRITEFLKEREIISGEYTICCKTPQRVEADTVMICCCPGCSHMFGTAFPGVKPVSLWRILPETDFPFPDYHGERMTIHDSCRARNRNSSEMQDAARALCRRMNIELTEPVRTRGDSVCCGGCASGYKARREMALKRAAELPEKNAVVYCTGCVRSLSLTDVRPRHLLDLLFREPTEGLTVKRP